MYIAGKLKGDSQSYNITVMLKGRIRNGCNYSTHKLVWGDVIFIIRE